MNNDLISREALKEAINTYDTFACLPDGKLYPIRELEHPEMFVTYIHVEDVIKAIDNAPTVDITEEQAIDKLHKTGWLPMHDKEMTEREK